MSEEYVKNPRWCKKRKQIGKKWLKLGLAYFNTTDNLERSASSHDIKDASAEMETSNSTNQDDFSEESLLLPRTHNDSEISESDDDINFTQEDAPSHYTKWVDNDTVK